MSRTNYLAASKRLSQGLFLLCMIGIWGIACNHIKLDEPENPKSNLNVHLTDAPADYEEINIDIQGLRIHYTPPGSDTVEVGEGDGEWIELPVEPAQINLLEFTNGVDTLLSSADLDPGLYQELRLILGENNTVVVDGEVNELQVPSGQQSGFKVNFETDLESDEKLDLIVDFDAARSVHEAGSSGRYILRPVLKAFVENGEESEVGSISGTVIPDDSDSHVFAIMGDDTTSTHVNTSGEFLIRGLTPGSYDLLVQPYSDQYEDKEVDGVLVEDDIEANVGEITLDEESLLSL